MAKKSKLKVTGLELETKDGKKVGLTLAEARDLHEQLDELFGKEVRDTIYIDRYRPYWNQPWITWNSHISSTGHISDSNVTDASVSSNICNTTVLLKTVGQESGLQISYTGVDGTAGLVAA